MGECIIFNKILEDYIVSDHKKDDKIVITYHIKKIGNRLDTFLIQEQSKNK